MVALITGAASDIGKSVALTLNKNGYDLIDNVSEINKNDDLSIDNVSEINKKVHFSKKNAPPHHIF